MVSFPAFPVSLLVFLHADRSGNTTVVRYDNMDKCCIAANALCVGALCTGLALNIQQVMTRNLSGPRASLHLFQGSHRDSSGKLHESLLLCGSKHAPSMTSPSARTNCLRRVQLRRR